MRLLVDTNILFWAISETARISRKTRMLLEDDRHQFWTSSISVAELRTKEAIGKLVLPAGFPGLVRESGYAPLAYSAAHAHRLEGLPLHHRDPFDRMLIAQALEEGLTILTSDKAFADYPVAVIFN